MKKKLTILTCLMMICSFMFGQNGSNYWNEDVSHDFGSSMTITGVLVINGTEQRTTQLEIGAFCGEEFRGSTILKYNKKRDRYFATLMIYSDDNDDISFKVYNHESGNILNVETDKVSFSPNATLGLLNDPYVFNFTSQVAKVDGVGYTTFADALTAVANGGTTLELLADATIANPINVTHNLTIVGNGKTLTYTGSGESARAIDVKAGTNANLTVTNLTIDCTSSYCQRGINYNTTGELKLEGVTVQGTNVTYALNLPGSSDNATVTINNSSLTANIALNVWGENATIKATSSHFTSVDNASHENYSAIVLNNDGSTIANGTVVEIIGGSITALDENGELSNAVRNATDTGDVRISDTTVVTGNYSYPVAIVTYGGDQFYSCATLQAAIDKAIATNAVSVKLIANVKTTEIITVTAPVVIDGNGKTVTSTAARAFNIETTGKVVVNNLTVNAGERAFNIINEAATVELNGVTATASNNAVMIATSAGAVNLTINDSDLTGLAVVNVAGAGSQAAINNTKITNVDANPKENYGAITIWTSAENAKVVVSGGEIIVADDSRQGYVFPATATIEGVEDVGYIIVTVGDAGYETLAEAIEDVKANGTISFIRNGKGAGVVINKDITIDFNGKTYTFSELGVGSGTLTSNGFQILKGNNVTLKNGTLNVAEAMQAEYYILVQNYANLNVENMNLDGTNLDKWSLTDGDSYVLSNNSGKVNIINSTITANNDGAKAFAFDVCKKASYEAPIVKLDAKSKINVSGDVNGYGKVELSGGQFFPEQSVTISLTKSVEAYQVAEGGNQLESGWYTIGVPFTVTPSLTEGYELFSYDAVDAMWRNHKNNNFDLERGRGYLYAHLNGADLTLEGEVTTEVYKTTLSYESLIKELNGFNLLGNPYTFSINPAYFEKGNVADGFYTLANDGAWVAKKDAEIAVGEGFLVQATANDDEFIINKAATRSENANNGTLQINVANNTYSDVAYVSFNEGIGLTKIAHQNANIPMVYIPVENKEYSIAYISENVEEVPFSFEAKTMGTYTISVKAQNCEFSTMTLVDRFTGVETNLLFEDYSFVAKSSDNSDRFIVRLSRGTLGLEEEHFAFINNNGLIINNASSNATLQIFDVMGRPVSSHNLSGNANISMESLTNGVYVLRLIDENNVRVQKVVID